MVPTEKRFCPPIIHTSTGTYCAKRHQRRQNIRIIWVVKLVIFQAQFILSSSFSTATALYELYWPWWRLITSRRRMYSALTEANKIFTGAVSALYLTYTISYCCVRNINVLNRQIPMNRLYYTLKISLEFTIGQQISLVLHLYHMREKMTLWHSLYWFITAQNCM